MHWPTPPSPPRVASEAVTGREDDGTGLYYYRARYYHPTLQRFIAEDPIGFAAGDMNLYGYVSNDPISFIDPLGLDKEQRCGSGNIRFNPAKGIAGVASTVNAGRLYTTGAVKLGVAAGVGVTGVGTPGSVTLAAWAFSISAQATLRTSAVDTFSVRHLRNVRPTRA